MDDIGLLLQSIISIIAAYNANSNLSDKQDSTDLVVARRDMLRVILLMLKSAEQRVTSRLDATNVFLKHVNGCTLPADTSVAAAAALPAALELNTSSIPLTDTEVIKAADITTITSPIISPITSPTCIDRIDTVVIERAREFCKNLYVPMPPSVAVPFDVTKDYRIINEVCVIGDSYHIKQRTHHITCNRRGAHQFDIAIQEFQGEFALKYCVNYAPTKQDCMQGHHIFTAVKNNIQAHYKLQTPGDIITQMTFTIEDGVINNLSVYKNNTVCYSFARI